ncbi:SMC-Scp complex subunit ScpB [Gordonibacter massiliensis (ex Traore et al. 2017)]|uniref:SMC-Scp complex subunit ScpB n=1 Tax=Gordonibacter massiliensis (ex Traore et al. 2017) TaxID=1841863 RepID=UPI001C8CB461|nr:SMC-Scp complex subunit ScpB [Gordonibacter massiliensis (ex Traore et al. 2017)]MBX9033308.1 SMC-Scp complex subunit ScpB [Gordonibacter massiliensis (ex Traore et al. 2017)]
MFQGLQESQLPGALEALLFVTDEPVGTIALADMLEVEPADVERALVDLRARFEDEERGVQLREVAGGWRLYTHPVYHELVEKYVLSWDTRKLSQAAMETLAIVAYSQPVTRAGVASVRGVNSDSSINSLVEKGLVREAGTADAPGNPVLYATTRAFLEKFGLRSVADLPDLDQFAPDDDTRAFIRERLSATREPVHVADEARMDGAGAGEGDGFDGVEFDFDGEGEAAVTLGEQLGGAQADGGERPLFARVDEAAEDAASTSAQSLLAEAMASGLGLVEKIDFDSLTFETDDE